MHAFPSRAPALGRIATVAGAAATLIVILFAAADPAAWANNAAAGAVPAQGPQGPPPAVDEARAAFRWEVNNLSNRALSAYMTPDLDRLGENRGLYQSLSEEFQDLAVAIDSDPLETVLGDTPPTVAEAAARFQAAADEIFGRAEAQYSADPVWTTYGRLVRAFGDAINPVKNLMRNNPDDVWSVATSNCLRVAYQGYVRMPGRPASEYPEFHALVLRDRIIFDGDGNPGRCPGPGAEAAQSRPAGPSPFMQERLQCPRGWCPHRGGCIPCGG